MKFAKLFYLALKPFEIAIPFQIKNRIKHSSLIEWYHKPATHQGIKKRILFLEQFLPKNGIGAELGVYKGDFSPFLLKHTNAKKLYLVDPWFYHKGGHWDWGNGNRSTVDALIKILRAFKKEIEDGRIIIQVGWDTQVLTTFPDQYFDWVYVDTSHTYEQTKKELQILTRKVKGNGVIAGDDWWPDPNHRHHGVYKAVREFEASTNYRIIYPHNPDLSNDQQWAINKS